MFENRNIKQARELCSADRNTRDYFQFTKEVFRKKKRTKGENNLALSPHEYHRRSLPPPPPPPPPLPPQVPPPLRDCF